MILEERRVQFYCVQRVVVPSLTRGACLKQYVVVKLYHHFLSFVLFAQVEIKRLEPKWSGSLMIGVTALPPQEACTANKASQLWGQSYILCANNGATCLFVGGQV